MITEELKVVVRAEAAQAVRELNKLKATTTQNTTGFANMAKTLVGIGGVTAALMATKRLVIDNIKAGVEYAAAIEKQTVAFEVLLGSGEKATRFMREIQEFSASTPFQLPELTSAAQRLLGFGTAAEDVVGTMRRLGDLSMGNSEVLNRLTLAYGKLQAKGRATLEELNMFTEAGVPLMRELGEQLGVAGDELFQMITKGEIGFEEVNQAITDMTSAGGQFFEMTQRQAETLAGRMSTLKDAFSNLRAEMLTEGGFVDALKMAVAEMTNMVNNIRDARTEANLGRSFQSNLALTRSEDFSKMSPTQQAEILRETIAGYEPARGQRTQSFSMFAGTRAAIEERSAMSELDRELSTLRSQLRGIELQLRYGGAAGEAVREMAELVGGRSFFMPGEREGAISDAIGIREQLMKSSNMTDINQVKTTYPEFFELFRSVFAEAPNAIPTATQAQFGTFPVTNLLYGGEFGVLGRPKMNLGAGGNVQFGGGGAATTTGPSPITGYAPGFPGSEWGLFAGMDEAFADPAVLDGVEQVADEFDRAAEAAKQLGKTIEEDLTDSLTRLAASAGIESLKAVGETLAGGADVMDNFSRSMGEIVMSILSSLPEMLLSSGLNLIMTGRPDNIELGKALLIAGGIAAIGSGIATGVKNNMQNPEKRTERASAAGVTNVYGDIYTDDRFQRRSASVSAARESGY